MLPFTIRFFHVRPYCISLYGFCQHLFTFKEMKNNIINTLNRAINLDIIDLQDARRIKGKTGNNIRKQIRKKEWIKIPT